MRLINVRSLTFLEHPHNRIPPYAILSHRWTGDEVSFVDFLSDGGGGDGGGDGARTRSSRSGYRKIEMFCRVAESQGFEWAWIDTCCIDKSSSAELSEAINSMYRWYHDAQVCLAYLDDVDDVLAIARSRWFTRGWTLQELLAPANVIFYSGGWQPLGTKVSLAVELCEITGIPTNVLEGTRSIFSTSVAQRMSWASCRETTRVEDTAYCLMGIFNVNMPMLYGEGDKAFRRLQEEILNDTTDQTLFAWCNVQGDSTPGGLLASHPRNFRLSGAFEDRSSLYMFKGRSYGRVKQGIEVNLLMTQLKQPATRGSGLRGIKAVLKCTEHDRPDRFAAIILAHVGVSGNEYVRLYQDRMQFSPIQGEETDIIVRNEMQRDIDRELRPLCIQVETVCTADDRDIPTVSVEALSDRSYPAPLTRDMLPLTQFKGSRTFHQGEAYLLSDPASYTYVLPPLYNGKEAVALKICCPGLFKEFFVSIGFGKYGKLGLETNHQFQSLADDVKQYTSATGWIRPTRDFNYKDFLRVTDVSVRLALNHAKELRSSGHLVINATLKVEISCNKRVSTAVSGMSDPPV